MTLTPREFDAFFFCNRYASVFEIKLSYFYSARFCAQVTKEAGADRFSWQYRPEKRIVPYHAGHLFYQLKNRLLAKYGKLASYTLQFWTAESYNRHDELEYKTHEHILETYRLKGRRFHSPTNHCSFSSDDGCSCYTKESMGFEKMKQMCGANLIKGQKIDRVEVKGAELGKVKKQFHHHLKFLIKSFRPLLHRRLDRAKPGVIVIHDVDYRENLQVVPRHNPEQGDLLADAPF